MNSNLLMNFSVDKENKKISVEREFAAPVQKVWAAWTESQLLDQWWAPKPWKAQTKKMDFKEGGQWLYAMVGPDGTAQWCLADYKSIHPMKSFSVLDAFCDEQGNILQDFPRSEWTNSFSDSEQGKTRVSIEISYKRLEDLEKIIEMGFQQGFTAGLDNLDALLAAQ